MNKNLQRIEEMSTKPYRFKNDELNRNGLRVRVGESLGWRFSPLHDAELKADALMCWIAPKNESWQLEMLPDWTSDANAQFEAWRSLDEAEREKFCSIAIELVKSHKLSTLLDAFNLHFCEIFLRAKNCWRE